MPLAPTPTFADVQTILDRAIDGWKQTNGGAIPRLAQKHRDPNFGWATKAQLLASTAKGFPLIAMANGKPVKPGSDANIVKALRDRDGVDNNGQMPDGGPFLKLNPDIQTIIDWIDADCPD